MSKLFDEWQKLKQKLKEENLDEKEEEDISNKLDVVEASISKEVSKDARDKIATLSNTDGTTNVNGMWTLKKKLFPKHSNPLPVAKINVDGRLVTSQNELKYLYLETFKHRFRHRPM